MTYRGKYKREPLAPCRVCEMDAGERMVTMTVPEEFFVQCMCCGFKTKRYSTQSAATKEWNGKSRMDRGADNGV